MRLEFHPEAELELIEAAVYYNERVPGLANVLNPRFAMQQICCSINLKSDFLPIQIFESSF
jgi:hypothetical protein